MNYFFLNGQFVLSSLSFEFGMWQSINFFFIFFLFSPQNNPSWSFPEKSKQTTKKYSKDPKLIHQNARLFLVWNLIRYSRGSQPPGRVLVLGLKEGPGETRKKLDLQARSQYATKMLNLSRCYLTYFGC